MTEIEIKKIQEIVENKGLLKTFVFSTLYIFALFFMGVAVIMLYDKLFHIDFNSPSYVGIVAAIFILVTSTDLILLLKTRITPTLLIGVILLSPFLVLYKLFTDIDLFDLNKKSTPAKIRKSLFPWKAV